MEFSPKLLAGLVVQAIILGGVLGFLYSLLRISRVLLGGRGQYPVSRKFEETEFPIIGKCLLKRKKRRSARIFLMLIAFLEDVLFCVIVALGIVLLAYVGNNGRIRWFMPLGVLCGFVLFELTAGRIIAAFSELLAVVIRLFVRYLIFFVLFPFKAVSKRVAVLMNAAIQGIRARLHAVRDRKFHEEETRRLLSAASVGFFCMKHTALVSATVVEQEAVNRTVKKSRNKKRRRVYGRDAGTEQSERSQKNSEAEKRKA